MLAVRISNTCQYKKKLSDQHLHVIFRIFRKVVILLTIICIVPMKTKGLLYIYNKKPGQEHTSRDTISYYTIFRIQKFSPYIYTTKIMSRSGWEYNFLSIQKLIINKIQYSQVSLSFSVALRPPIPGQLQDGEKSYKCIRR